MVRDDYDIWVEVLRKEKPRIAEFDLYGTKAALLWKDNEDEVSVVCITQFANEVPQTHKYDHYEFDIKEWYWRAIAPRGSAGRIKEELEKLFKPK